MNEKNKYIKSCPFARKITNYNRFGDPFTVFAKCGKCELCLESRRSAWVSRLALELYSRRQALFVTLTYAPEHLPTSHRYCSERGTSILKPHKNYSYLRPSVDFPIGTLCKRDYVNFVKRVRKSYTSDSGFSTSNISYFVSGEYGSRLSRPHYHLLLFADDFMLLERSVRKSWSFGSIDIKTIHRPGSDPLARDNPINALRYTLKYLNKSTLNPFADLRVPEFVQCSNRPMLGDRVLPAFANLIASNNLFVKPALGLVDLIYLENNYTFPSSVGHNPDFVRSLPADSICNIHTMSDVPLPYIRFCGAVFSYRRFPFFGLQSNGDLLFPNMDAVVKNNFDGSLLRFTSHQTTVLFLLAFPGVESVLSDFNSTCSPSAIDAYGIPSHEYLESLRSSFYNVMDDIVNSQEFFEDSPDRLKCLSRNDKLLRVARRRSAFDKH